MKEYRCYYCDSEVFASGSYMPDEVSYNVSTHCHIATEFLCNNSECETTHLEMVDKNDNLLYFGPLEAKKGL